MFSVQCSVFSVQCSVFCVQCCVVAVVAASAAAVASAVALLLLLLLSLDCIERCRFDAKVFDICTASRRNVINDEEVDAEEADLWLRYQSAALTTSSAPHDIGGGWRTVHDDATGMSHSDIVSLFVSHYFPCFVIHFFIEVYLDSFSHAFAAPGLLVLGVNPTLRDEMRQYQRRHRIVNRWWLYVLLVKNPSLRQHRKTYFGPFLFKDRFIEGATKHGALRRNAFAT